MSEFIDKASIQSLKENDPELYEQLKTIIKNAYEQGVADLEAAFFNGNGDRKKVSAEEYLNKLEEVCNE